MQIEVAPNFLSLQITPSFLKGLGYRAYRSIAIELRSNMNGFLYYYMIALLCCPSLGWLFTVYEEMLLLYYCIWRRYIRCARVQCMTHHCTRHSWAGRFSLLAYFLVSLSWLAGRWMWKAGVSLRYCGLKMQAPWGDMCLPDACPITWDSTRNLPRLAPGIQLEGLGRQKNPRELMWIGPRVHGSVWLNLCNSFSLPNCIVLVSTQKEPLMMLNAMITLAGFGSIFLLQKSTRTW